MMPALSVITPSRSGGVMTVAFVPTLSSSTVSPAFSARAGAGAFGRLPPVRPMRRSASFIAPRMAARASLRLSAAPELALRRSSRISSNAFSAVARASSRMRAASSRAVSVSFLRSSSISRTSASARRSRSSASRRAWAARRSSSSIFRRLASRLDKRSSNFALSLSTSSRAREMIASGRPRRWEMANALDLPGTPISRRYVGRSVSMSNSHAAFSMPGVVSAKAFSSA